MSKKHCTDKTPETLWSRREVLKLAIGLKKYGYGNLEKISAKIKTKSPTQIKAFIHLKVDEIRKAKIASGPKKEKTQNDKEKVLNALHKFRKFAESRMPSSPRQEQGLLVIKKHLQKYYNEARLVTDPNALDMKAIFKYMLDWVSGEEPKPLRGPESAYITLFVRRLRELALNHRAKLSDKAKARKK